MIDPNKPSETSPVSSSTPQQPQKTSGTWNSTTGKRKVEEHSFFETKLSWKGFKRYVGGGKTGKPIKKRRVAIASLGASGAAIFAGGTIGLAAGGLGLPAMLVGGALMGLAYLAKGADKMYTELKEHRNAAQDAHDNQKTE